MKKCVPFILRPIAIAAAGAVAGAVLTKVCLRAKRDEEPAPSLFLFWDPNFERYENEGLHILNHSNRPLFLSAVTIHFGKDLALTMDFIRDPELQAYATVPANDNICIPIDWVDVEESIICFADPDEYERKPLIVTVHTADGRSYSTGKRYLYSLADIHNLASCFNWWPDDEDDEWDFDDEGQQPPPVEVEA